MTRPVARLSLLSPPQVPIHRSPARSCWIEKDQVMTEAVGVDRIVPIVPEGVLLKVEFVEAAAVRADPQHLGSILINRPDEVIAQARRIRRAAPIGLKNGARGRFRIRIPSTQTAAVGTPPTERLRDLRR